VIYVIIAAIIWAVKVVLTRGKNNLFIIPHSTSLYSESFTQTGLQLYNPLLGYLKEIPISKFKSQLQALLRKNGFYSVNEFKEFF
jgi:hypothetical protein